MSKWATISPPWLLDRTAPLVLYCRSGRRSGVAEQTLRRMGYRQIENKGGLGDMQRSGYFDPVSLIRRGQATEFRGGWRAKAFGQNVQRDRITDELIDQCRG